MSSSFRFNPITSPEFTFGETQRGGNNSITASSSAIPSFASPPLNQTKTSLFGTSNTTPASTSLSSTQQQQRQRKNKSQSNQHSSTSSLALSCQSPDSLSIHTLIKDNTCIQTQTLPLHKSDQVIIQTQLPSWLISTLKIDPPVELMCVDNDTTITSHLKSLSSSVSSDGRNKKKKVVTLPLLCLYTTKGLYIIEACVLPQSGIYNNDGNNINNNNTSRDQNGNIIFMGRIESIHEPLETYIQENDHNLSIQRVRPAPYTHIAGGSLYNLSPFIPKGCMAILLSSSSTSTSSHNPSTSATRYSYYDKEDEYSNEEEYSYSQLILFHGIDNMKKNTSSNRTFTNNSNNNDRNITISEINTIDPLVDFTFLPSTNNDSSTNIWNNTSSLWNGMTIALSTTDGELFTMTPIVFHGMAIPRHLILDSIQWLKMAPPQKQQCYVSEKENDNPKHVNTSASTTAALTIGCDNESSIAVSHRRNAAALVYIKDVFGIEDDDNHGGDDELNQSNVTLLKKKYKSAAAAFVVTANVFNHINKKRTAASWPIAIQGPVYKPTESTADKVACVESLAPPLLDFTPTDNNSYSTSSGYTSSILLVCGKNGECIQYVMIPSGVNCIPRFAFESGEDSEFLDGSVDNIGVLVEEIVLDDEDGNEDINEADIAEEMQLGLIQNNNIKQCERKRVVVIVDPTDIGMIHHFSTYGVVTITTNALKVMRERLWRLISQNEQTQDNHKVKTKAWSSIDILEMDGDRAPTVTGVAVSGDAQIGHILVAVLSDGTTEGINLTAAQYLKEGENLEHNTLAKIDTSIDEEKQANEALAAVNDIEPLQAQISPLFEKIYTGLSGMSKIVGGNTQPKDINAGMLATFLSIKQTNENDVVIPLQQLNAIVTSHLQYMQSMYDNQKSQLKGLKIAIASLEQKIKKTNEKHKSIESNSKVISERSANILSTVRELTPTITDAEREYFKDIQRFAANSEKLEEKFKDIKNGCQILSQSLNKTKDEMKSSILLTQEQKQNCEALLEGQKQKLVDYESSIQSAVHAMQNLSSK